MINKETGREMNNGKRRRFDKFRFRCVSHRVPPIYNQGTRDCRCGRTISANAASCLACSHL